MAQLLQDFSSVLLGRKPTKASAETVMKVLENEPFDGDTLKWFSRNATLVNGGLSLSSCVELLEVCLEVADDFHPRCSYRLGWIVEHDDHIKLDSFVKRAFQKTVDMCAKAPNSDTEHVRLEGTALSRIEVGVKTASLFMKELEVEIFCGDTDTWFDARMPAMVELGALLPTCAELVKHCLTIAKDFHPRCSYRLGWIADKYGSPADVAETRSKEGFQQCMNMCEKLLKEQSSDVECIRLQGTMYRFGLGTKENPTQAVNLYKRGVECKDPFCINHLGVSYSSGEGVEADLVEAARLYQIAADLGDVSAQYNLACSYADGEGVKKDIKKAVEFYQMAVDQGDSSAQYNLGLCYATGDGVKQDLVKAAKLYQLAADQGDELAQYNLGHAYANGNGVKLDHVKAAELYQKSADQGDVCAQYNLAHAYANGHGVLKNWEKAVELYTMAADQGYELAQYNLAHAYANGNGTTQDYAKAAELYKKAADQGYKYAQYNLGHAYANGNGVAQSYTKAVELYKLAADQGYTLAQYNLGHAYAYGNGVPRDLSKAAQMYELAAAQGYSTACYNVARLYEAGTGVEADYGKAAEYFFKAANGVDPPDYKIAESSLDKVVKLCELASSNDKARRHLNAIHSMGYIFEHGFGVTTDILRAMKYYFDATLKGSMVSKVRLHRDYWSWDKHSIYPPSLKERVQTVLTVALRHQSCANAGGDSTHLALPNELWLLILRYFRASDEA
eukprot:m.27012 g.27012  ORF g.27012 m.27012 type:complete len:731 (+) comp15637_c1_seq1:492-2684(+)